MIGEIGQSWQAKPMGLAMVGGGPGSFAGRVHLGAARMDNQFELVAGVFSSDPDRSQARGNGYGLVADRCYRTLDDLLDGEARRDDPVAAIAIIAPPITHYGAARAALAAGFHVMCEKPITVLPSQAADLVAVQAQSGALVCASHNYSGYPMVRQARAMVEAGELGDVTMIQAEFAQGYLAGRSTSDAGRRPWAYDPAGAPVSMIALGLGPHLHHLVRYVTLLDFAEICADISAASPASPACDYAGALIRMSNGARGFFWLTNVAAGSPHGLRIVVHGSLGRLEWQQQSPDVLAHQPLGGPARTLRRGEEGLHPLSLRATRTTMGHPEGFVEAFANIYTDFGMAIRARRAGSVLDPLHATYPDLRDGALSIEFAQALLASAQADGHWTTTT